MTSDEGHHWRERAELADRAIVLLRKERDAALRERDAALRERDEALRELAEWRARQHAARAWFNAPNPDLDNATPLEVIKGGDPQVVAALLEDALLGHPG